MENEKDMSNVAELDDEALQELYSWIDEIPLSRPKRNIARDFSDGVLVAEIVNHFIPKMVEMHNYSAANSVNQKKDNWSTLQRKVLCRLEYRVTDDLVDGVCKCRTGAIELFLINLRNKIDKFLAKRRAAALRKQNQVFDEFSSNNLPDNIGHLPDNDTFTNGTGNMYGYPPYNIAQQQEMMRNMIAAGLAAQNEYYQQGSYRQQPQQQQQQMTQSPPVNQQPSLQALKKSQHVMTKRESSDDMTHSEHKQPGAKQQAKVIPQNVKLLLEEKEQALLASQETVQILQVKIRRLEHLLNLKDIRIDDLTKKLEQAMQPHPRHLPPQSNPPVPPLFGAAGQPLPRMRTTPPLPPVRSPPKNT